MANTTVEEGQALESTTVGIFRTATVVKGGRRFSFAALVVVGDRAGNVGLGYGKGRGVPVAIEKAQKDARKQLFRVPMNGTTLPHPIEGRFSSARVRMLPAAPGTGVVAGGTVRAVLEMAGVGDTITKAFGSSNQKNLCKAVIQGLQSLKTREHVAAARSVNIESTTVDEMLEASQRSLEEQESAGSGGEQKEQKQRASASRSGGGGVGSSKKKGKSEGEGETKTSEAQTTSEPRQPEPGELGETSTGESEAKQGSASNERAEDASTAIAEPEAADLNESTDASSQGEPGESLQQ